MFCALEEYSYKISFAVHKVDAQNPNAPHVLGTCCIEEGTGEWAQVCKCAP